MKRSPTTTAAVLFLAAAVCAQEPVTPPANPAAATSPAVPPEAPPVFKIYRPNRPAKEADYKVAKWGPRGLPSPGYAFRAAKVIPITSARSITWAWR